MLYCGDNLEFMKTLDKDSIDLIYLDPPYFTQRDFGEFDDRWKSRNHYLSFMRDRLKQCKRILQSKGCIYLHCDSTCSHYIKIELDGIFGESNFRNEIIWSYRRWPVGTNLFQKMHDTIFRYSKSDDVIWNQLYEPLAPATLKSRGTMKHKQAIIDGKYIDLEMTEQSPGLPMRDVWDISLVQPQEKQNTKYPTQKPTKLLERIIESSSNKGDTVFDPFCGSGTSLVVAKQLKRKYIGCDINQNAVYIAQDRLSKTHSGLF